MNKEEILQLVKEKIISGEISKSDVNNLFEDKSHNSNKVVNILYTIGGIVILAGIVALLVQSWEDLGSFTRILTSLGMSIALFISSAIVVKKNKAVLAEILGAVALIVLPIGLFVTLYEQGVEVEEPLIMSIIFAVSALVPIISYFGIYKMRIYKLFGAIFSTVFAYTLFTYLLENNIYDTFNGYLYLTLALGISLILFGRHVKEGLISGVGTLMLLSGGIALSGIWDTLFIFILVAVLLLSVYLRSKAMLIFGSLFLIGYLFEITAKYFANSIGWGIALILLGIFTILIAIATWKVSSKYINE